MNFCNSYKIILNDNYENKKNKTIEQKNNIIY